MPVIARIYRPGLRLVERIFDHRLLEQGDAEQAQAGGAAAAEEAVDYGTE